MNYMRWNRIIGICLIVLLFGVGRSWAQQRVVKNLTTFDDKKIHFGFTLGINVMDFSLEHYNTLGESPWIVPEDYSNITTKRNLAGLIPATKLRADVKDYSPGFTVGMVSSLRLSPSLNLRFVPGLSFGQRKLFYIDLTQNIAKETIVQYLDGDPSQFYKVKSTYMDFPLLLKYKSSRLINYRPYVIAGGAMRVDLAKSKGDDLVQLKKTGFYLEAGIGLDSYLQFFRLSTELKISIGLTDVLKRNYQDEATVLYSKAFKQVRADMVTLSFHFE
ncbi:PorT family protein [Puteibacter caeruleilacunae]|nr:PorT family protein [Puteibacter caeruleilacunae]